MSTYRDAMGLNVVYVDASERFLTALSGVTDPEKKRKIIGELFVRVFEEEAKKTGAQFLLQGTIYPDRIESGMGGSATIKSHHNVGGLPKDSLFKKENIVEPLKSLFKDEVRAVGEALGIPRRMVWRQPFPGPGLAVRVVGEITREKLDILRKSDAIYLEELENAGLSRRYLAVLRRAHRLEDRRRDGRWPHLRLLRRPARRDQRRRHDRRSRGASLSSAKEVRQPHHKRSPRRQPRRLRHHRQTPGND